MKCSACGMDNVQGARFCAFCGAKLAEAASAPAEEKPEQSFSARQTARPLQDNPYQPPRSPVIPAAKPAGPAVEPEPEKESAGPRQIIKPSPKRVFLFDEEVEEEEARRAREEQQAKRREPDEFDEFDEFEEDEYDEDDDDIYDEEDSPSAGRIFVRIFSVLTILILIAGIVAFLFGTTLGRRLRASVGLSTEAEDFMLLADWQLEQNCLVDASNSYYTAFKLDMDNYDLALRVGTGFELSSDDLHAEQLYSYLIANYPQEDEPYDRVLALLNRQGRSEDYESMLIYRSQHQAGYLPPTTPAPAAPTASHQGGAYSGSIHLALDAGGAEIRFTLDGTAPTADSFLYTGPITLGSGTHNLRAVAVRDGQLSQEWTASFVIS